MVDRKFILPPLVHNVDGRPRKVGFEFELSGIEIQDCARLVADLFGGQVVAKHSLESEVTDTGMGTFRVELDSRMIKDMATSLEKKQPVHAGDLVDMNAVREEVSAWMGKGAEQIVPCEIVTPPLPFDDFSNLERLREALWEKKAKGTGAFVLNAFGVHINPEVASEKVEYIRDILRAFLILYPWLVDVMQVDLARRMVTFIDPFPEDYVKLVLSEVYAPSLDQFMNDYLDYNPTRNRALDLLPLFAHLKPEKLDVLDEDVRRLVKARPTFHYRLPNCEVDDVGWRISRDWNYWVQVEKLAQDKQMLADMAFEYRVFLDSSFHTFSNEWSQQVARQLGYADKAHT